MDLLAEKLQMDPLELRMKNLLKDGDRYCTGETMHDVHFARLLQDAADAVAWSESRKNKGLCVMLKGMQTPSRATIAVEAEDGGTYTVRCATTEMGQGAKMAMRLRRGRRRGRARSRYRPGRRVVALAPRGGCR
jgi:CO/xanthine dehydrogenase Mo-binding subunit